MGLLSLEKTRLRKDLVSVDKLWVNEKREIWTGVANERTTGKHKALFFRLKDQKFH